LLKDQTILCVKPKTNPNTNAWTAATVILEPLGGKDSKIPGVKIKKSNAV
jgi:hypothetical protein